MVLIQLLGWLEETIIIEVPDYLLLRYNLISVKPVILESLEKKDQRCPP